MVATVGRAMRSLSLRARLLALTLALTTVGFGVAGVVTYGALRSFLLDRVDAQLRSAQDSALDVLDEARRPGGRVGRPGGPGEPGNLPQGIVGALYAPDGTPFPFAIQTNENLFTRDGRGFRTQTIEGLGSYRLLVDRVSTTFAGRLALDPGGHIQFVAGIPLKDANSTLSRLIAIELLVGFVALAAIAGAGLWLVRVGLRPLDDIEQTAAAIAKGDLSQRIEVAPPRTEVGRLGSALNTMLGTIEASFAEREASERRLRQFVADASHELQTPLTSVRGYAELFRRGAAERPADLANAMHRIEAEAQRMGVLVDDLLMLARLDQGRPLVRERIDLVPLVRELVGDAHVVDGDRSIELDGDTNAVIVGDAARIKQVVTNLLSNARKHTPAGTPIHVSVRKEGDGALIAVADRGPGMPAAHAQRVFERFFRADPSRARASGGSGLGLSIVSAIVAAHGGTVEVTTAPGDGATFTVHLPASPPLRGDDQSQEAPSVS